MDKGELRRVLEACGAIKFGKFTLASGRESDYYIDMKRAMTDPAVLKRIAVAASELVKGADRLAGMELGAIPLVVAISLETGIPYVMVRKERKGHGTGRRIEGEIKEGEKVIVVEDVTTTGGSLLRAAEAVMEAGGKVERVLVIVDRQEGASELITEKGLEFVPLLVRDDIRK